MFHSVKSDKVILALPFFGPFPSLTYQVVDFNIILNVIHLRRCSMKIQHKNNKTIPHYCTINSHFLMTSLTSNTSRTWQSPHTPPARDFQGHCPHTIPCAAYVAASRRKVKIPQDQLKVNRKVIPSARTYLHKAKAHLHKYIQCATNG